MATKALVVGGDGRKLTSALASFDIEVAHAWPPEQAQPQKEVPQDATLVLLLVDGVPHAKFAGPLKKVCDSRGISFVASLSRMPQLGRALTLGGFVSNSSDSLAHKRAEAPPPKPEEPAMPVTLPTPPVAQPEPFDALLVQLKATLKLMRDGHHVEEVFWSKEHGLNVTRKQSIDTDLD